MAALVPAPAAGPKTDQLLALWHRCVLNRTPWPQVRHQAVSQPGELRFLRWLLAHQAPGILAHACQSADSRAAAAAGELARRADQARQLLARKGGGGTFGAAMFRADQRWYAALPV